MNIISKVLETENWELENGKKNRILLLQKVAKTGNNVIM